YADGPSGPSRPAPGNAGTPLAHTGDGAPRRSSAPRRRTPSPDSAGITPGTLATAPSPAERTPAGRRSSFARLVRSRRQGQENEHVGDATSFVPTYVAHRGSRSPLPDASDRRRSGATSPPPHCGQRRAMPITESRAEVAEHIRHLQPRVAHGRALRRARGPARPVSSLATRPVDWRWRRPCWWRCVDTLTW